MFMTATIMGLVSGASIGKSLTIGVIGGLAVILYIVCLYLAIMGWFLVIHELGHYVVARMVGWDVFEFQALGLRISSVSGKRTVRFKVPYLSAAHVKFSSSQPTRRAAIAVYMAGPLANIILSGTLLLVAQLYEPSVFSTLTMPLSGIGLAFGVLGFVPFRMTGSFMSDGQALKMAFTNPDDFNSLLSFIGLGDFTHRSRPRCWTENDLRSRNDDPTQEAYLYLLRNRAASDRGDHDEAGRYLDEVWQRIDHLAGLPSYYEAACVDVAIDAIRFRINHDRARQALDRCPAIAPKSLNGQLLAMTQAYVNGQIEHAQEIGTKLKEQTRKHPRYDNLVIDEICAGINRILDPAVGASHACSDN